MRFDSLPRISVSVFAVMLTFLALASCGVNEKSSRAACASNMKQIYMALNQYRAMNDVFPSIPGKNTTQAGGKNHVDNLFLVRKTEAGNDADLFICPSDPGAKAGTETYTEDLKNLKESDFTTENNSYAYFMGAADGSRKMDAGIISDGFRTSKGDDISDVTDDGWGHGGAGNWITVDGSLQQSESENWPDLVQGNDNAKGDWKSFMLD